MRTLGIDPSLSSTGWAIVEDGKVIDCGTIKTKAKDGFVRRLRTIKRELTDKAIHGAFCNYAAIEDVFVNYRNIKTSIQLAKVHGIIISTLQDGGFDDDVIKIYPPSFVKQTITGNGNASKEQVIKMVQIIAGYKGNQSDEADASAVALTCEREIEGK